MLEMVDRLLLAVNVSTLLEILARAYTLVERGQLKPPVSTLLEILDVIAKGVTLQRI